MISLLTILLGAATTVLIKLAIKHPTRYACDFNKFTICAVCTGIFTMILLICTLSLGVQLGYCRVVDSKIAMYVEENTKIEAEISDIVSDYKEYEADVLKECSGKSPITLVQLYPELKSDALVKSQIKLYKENNQKIKELKLEKINYDVKRWLLYFGGSKG